MNAPSDSTPITFTLEEVKTWVEWFDVHASEFMRMFRAIEELTDEANAGMRVSLHPDHARGTRYDEIEEHRNEALKMLNLISSAERTIREAMQERLHASWLERERAAK